ncbi:hypothetical protein D3C72_1942290 [compost metagenome]
MAASDFGETTSHFADLVFVALLLDIRRQIPDVGVRMINEGALDVIKRVFVRQGEA